MSQIPQTLEAIAASFHAGKRERTSRFVTIDGHTVLKENNYSLEGGRCVAAANPKPFSVVVVSQRA